MRSKILTSLFVMIVLSVLVVPARLAAQEQNEQNGEHQRYKLVDIPTFGGPISLIHLSAGGSPNPINSRGATVGGAATAMPSPPNSFLCGLTLGFVSHAFEWQKGVVTDLGALSGADNCSVATSINKNEEIAGYSENGAIDPLVGLKAVRAVLWKDGKIKNLGTFGGNESGVAQINNRGQIVGVALNAIPDPFSLIYLFNFGSSNGTQARAFLWQDGEEMQDLGTLGGPDANAVGLNERGQVIGISYINSTPNPTTGVPTADPFLWTKDKGMIDLGTLGGTFGGPSALNNRGQVIGQSSVAAGPAACFTGNDPQNCHPFLWDEGKLIDLNTDTVGGNPRTANAINDAGEVVGGGAFPNRPFHAYLWRHGVATDLGTLNGDCLSEAIAINSRGQVVGNSVSCDGSKQRSFLWENGSMVDLNKLIPPHSDLQLVQTAAINHRGEIVGNGVPPGCGDVGTCGHAYVLIPCDGEHSDEKGCEDEGDARTAAIQNNPAPANQRPTSAMEAGMTAREIGARMRARFGPESWLRCLDTKMIPQK